MRPMTGLRDGLCGINNVTFKLFSMRGRLAPHFFYEALFADFAVPWTVLLSSYA